MYAINVGDYTVGETVYSNRCLSASFGGSGIESEIIPWEGTDHKPWDYKYENGTFVLDVIEIQEEIPEPSQLDRISAQALYTAMMTDTLIAEG